MPRELEKAVSIELGGKTRKLVLDFNAYATIEEHTNQFFGDALAAFVSQPRAHLVRLVVFAALRTTDPQVTLEDVGSWITTDNFPYVGEKVAELLNLYFERRQSEGQAEANPPQAEA